MTRAEIISACRYYVNETSTAAGALLDDDANLLDFINDSVEDVVLDLVPIMPEQLLKRKTITLVASQANYSLAATITGTTIAFADSDPDTITDSGSGFVTAGFESGMTITISGAAQSGNNSTFTIETVAAGTLTLDADDEVTAEGAANSITITQQDPFLQIDKVERYVTGQPPREIRIIDSLDLQDHTNIGDSEADPDACYFIGDTMYFVETPSAAKEYVRVWMVRQEPTTIPNTGPKYIPRIAHRLIVYRTMLNIGELEGVSVARFGRLYDERLKKITRVWAGRYQQEPRFVRPSVSSRRAGDARDRAFYDDSGYFGD